MLYTSNVFNKHKKKHKRESHAPLPPMLRAAAAAVQSPFPHTYIQMVSCGMEQLLGRVVQSVKQDSVSTFAVESDLPLWIPHCA